MNREYKNKKNIKYKKYFKYDDSSLFNKRIDKEIKLADCIIVSSLEIKKSLRYYPTKLKNINIINYPFNKPIKANKKKWFDGKRKLKVLYVGRLDPRKGLTHILDSVSNLKKNKLLEKFEFSFIGDGKLSNLIKKKFSEVNLLNSLSNKQVLERMHLSDVLLFPSLFEGYGLSAAEAMSQGMTVISSKNCGFLNACSLKDVILLAKPSGTEISKLLLKLYNNPRLLKKIGNEAILTAKKNQIFHYKKKITKILRAKTFEQFN